VSDGRGENLTGLESGNTIRSHAELVKLVSVRFRRQEQRGSVQGVTSRRARLQGWEKAESSARNGAPEEEKAPP